ncbi:MAG: alanine--glyoxylate aminotransferase family protein [Candidatus Aminicenantes bacterium]|nr:alanine--glyoxylate aminotransferase family protein [Candidatus Aminicenantes bacterium]
MAHEKLLLIPGPSPVHPRIIHSLSQPTVSHVSPVLAEEFTLALENLKKTVFTRKGEAFVFAGGGTLSMETAAVNIIGPTDRVLIVSHGYFGERMAELCRSFGFDCDLLECEWGEAVPPERLEDRMAEGGYSVVAATHVDTATGVCAPVREYARILKGREALFILDGVCATGGVEERMDDWGIDVILTAPQKCFGAPPGLAICVFSERAMDKRKRLKSVPAYYADILRWLPVMKDPTKYFSTHGVNEIRAFAESTRIVMEEGLEARFARHARTAKAIRLGLAGLGFSLFTRDHCLADTLSVIHIPAGLEDAAFRAAYLEQGVVVAGGLAHTAGRVFRMGHMGNLSSAQVLFALDALERTLKHLNVAFEKRAGVQAAKSALES